MFTVRREIILSGSRYLWVFGQMQIFIETYILQSYFSLQLFFVGFY